MVCSMVSQSKSIENILLVYIILRILGSLETRKWHCKIFLLVAFNRNKCECDELGLVAATYEYFA